MSAWKDYQEEAAEFFRSLSLEAETDVTVKGVRTEHDNDVLVKLDVAGFKVIWIVECKHWKTAVTKLHVFALREIVSDLGADRGIILCEAGFQSGAFEAANLTNSRSRRLLRLGPHRKMQFTQRVCEIFMTVPRIVVRGIGIFQRRCVSKKGCAPTLVMKTAILGHALSRCHMTYYLRLLAAYTQSIPIHDYAGVTLPEHFDSHEDVVNALEPLLRELEAKLATVEKT